MIRKGFPEDQRHRAAELYWQAFGPKLGRVLGQQERAVALISRSLDPSHAYCALDGSGTLIGFAGFRSPHGALTRDRLRDFTATYGTLTGCARWLAMRLLSGPEGTALMVDGLAVALSARSRGVGTALVEAVAREALERGYDRLELEVAVQNTKARNLYLRRGFEPAAQRQKRFFGWLTGITGTERMVRYVAP